MKYTLDLTYKESELIWNAVADYAHEIRKHKNHCVIYDDELIQNVLDKIAAMDEEIIFNELN